MEKKIELKVGDFVDLRGRLCGVDHAWSEVLAWCTTESHFSLVVNHHIAYASTDGVKVVTYLTSSRLVFTQAGSDRIEEGSFVDASMVPPSKFGTANEVAEHLLESTLNDSRHNTLNIHEFLSDRRFKLELTRDGISGVITVFSPVREPNGTITLYLNAKDVKRDRRTTMKPGRAFKHMFHLVPDKIIAELTEAWIEETTPRAFNLCVGGEAEDFRKAYNGLRAAYRNPSTTSYRKSIATSCMHNTHVRVDGVSISPTEVYASGDFKVAWLETPEGLVAGRVVFSARVGHQQTHAPIYGACEQSLDMLSDYLGENNIKQTRDLEDWVGLNLLKIEDGYGSIVGPYLDGELSGEDMGKYILLRGEGDGSLKFGNTDGYVQSGIVCDCCGDHTNEEDMCSSPEGLICEHCFNGAYTHAYNGDVIEIDRAVTVFVMNSGSNRSYEIVVDTDEAVYCELLDQYWHQDDVTFSECGEAIPTHRTGDFPELFPSDDEIGDLEEAA